ncbi:beta strand repeat-containing protein [Acidovorax sp. BL-A-41-H1]|uniref:beta strand repeat-containing protein n=1 Tax=Acidovorax sp. BL-A-41-H1 TaxID=3421102 RepID=UPI003F794CE2
MLHTLGLLRRRLGGAVVRLGAAAVLALAVCAPMQAQAQHTSGECPAQTATVTAGGTVTINISDCEVPGFGGIGRIDGGNSGTANMEDHGVATTRRDVSGAWFLDYSHNGSTGIGSTDVFELSDGSMSGIGDIQFTITINASASPITVSPGVLPALTAGVAFSQTLTSTGGLAPYSYALQSGVLPPGLSLTSGGVLSGTPTERGAYSFSVRSTDATTPTAQFVDKGYTGTVANPTLTLATPSGTAIQSVAFSQTLSTTGGVAPYVYQLETGTFPAGIAVSSAGVVSGTTSAATGNYPVTLRVTDSSTGPGQYFEVENYTLTVSPPPSVSMAVSPASVSEDGAANLTYTVTRSLNLSSPTVVNITTSGTATSGTDFTGGVATVTIPAGATTATIVIDPAVDGTVEPDETVILTVAAGTGYTVGAPSSATGTILNDDVPSATISVAPASVAEDGAPSLVFTVSLNQASFSATSVNFTIGGTATNGTDYATVASPLVIPAGNTTGTITVNPTADATIEADETVTLTLAAGAGYTVGVPNSATGTILNDDLPNLTINDVSLNEGNAGITNFTFTVSLSAPAGPGGVNFNIATANGSATAGTDYVANSLTSQTIPAGSTTYMFTVLVNGDTLNEPSETFFVNVTGVTNAVVVDGQGVGTIVNDDPLPGLSIDDVSVVEGNAGTASAVLTVTLNAASGQTVSVNYATADGTATQPADYTSASGTLTFTPGQTTRTITVPVIGETVPEANETFFVNLSGATNATITDNQGVGTIANDDVPVTVSPATLAGSTVAVAYSQTLTASGGTGPYSFAITAGAVPAGLSLSPSGVLSGTPTAAGSFGFTVTASDSSPFPGPFAGAQAYTLAVGAPTLSITPATLPGGTRTVPYATTNLAASGGTAPYTYAITAGALPGGLTLTGAGVLSGTPTATGSFNFTVTATDSSTGTGPFTALRTYTVAVADAVPVANNSAHTVAYGSSSNTVPLNITGGAATSVAVVTSPSHGTTSATGATIQYTPTAGYAGPDSFTYTATNGSGTSAPATVTLTVSPPTIAVTPAGPLGATVGNAYSQTFTWGGGAAPYTGIQVLNLPAGLSVTATTTTTATVSGTPTAAGSVNLNLSATDSSTGTGPFSGGGTVVLTVAAPTIAVAPATLPSAQAYTAYSQALTASGGIAPHTFAVTAGALPPGLTLTSAGVLSGTAGATGTYNFTVTASDSSATPYTGSRAYTLSVVQSKSFTGPSPTGGGNITASFTGGGAGCVFSSAQFIPLTGNAASPPANSAPQGVQFPHGLFDFATTGCTPGSTLQFTITYPTGLPGNVQYWKYGPTPTNAAPHWYTLGAGIAGSVVTFSITDGALGDDNLAADGQVIDAGGPGVGPGALTAVPLGDGLPWLIALALAAVTAWRRYRTGVPLGRGR